MDAGKIRCAHCGRDTTWDAEPRGPFCSQRCRLVDLGSWLGEKYKVPEDDSAPRTDNEEPDRGAGARGDGK
jgi:uncharacterized protein